MIVVTLERNGEITVYNIRERENRVVFSFGDVKHIWGNETKKGGIRENDNPNQPQSNTK